MIPNSKVRFTSKSLLIVCSCTYIIPFVVSCASPPHRQTYLSHTSLYEVSSVKVVTAAYAPDVSYSRDAPNRYAVPTVGLAVSPAFGLLSAVVESLVRSAQDEKNAAQIRKAMDLNQVEYVVAHSFVQELKKGKCFRTVDYMPGSAGDNHSLPAGHYDAVIRLTVRDLLLERVPGGKVRLRVVVHGNMEKVNSENILWDRDEVLLSPQFHSLDYYKKNGLVELDGILKTAGRNLAYDFVYLK